MNKLIHALLLLLGVSLLVPAFALAQGAPPTAPEPAPADPNVTHPSTSGSASVDASVSTTPAPTTTTVPTTVSPTVAPKVKANVKASANASTTPRATTAVKLEARLERAKTKAAQEIERRTAALTKLEERIDAMKRVSSQFKGDLSVLVDTEIANLLALKTRIEASTDGEEIKSDVQSITKSYRIFALVMPKASVAAAADKIVRMSATLTELGSKLKVRIDAKATAGGDVSALTSALNELGAKILSANTHAQAAVNGTATLMPDEGDKAKMEANKTALEAARTELKAAHEDIKAARALVKQIIDELKTDKQTANTSTDL